MITCFDTVKTLVRSEKAAMAMENGKYSFRVNSRATKIDVKRAIEEIYNVKVRDVNILNVRGKKKRVRYQAGYTSAWKKAIVTLKDGETIEVA